jgi:REP element-mobilizing transposase RayT
MKPYYHVSSKALEKNDIFLTREDFVTAMNDIALCSLRYDVKILCFCLMCNHFHFVLRGSYKECYAFMNEFKRICAIRMRDRTGEVSGLKDVDLHFDLLDTQEYLENAIAYVLRNPLAARIIMMPYFYEWSSISAYFRGCSQLHGLPLNTLSVRKRREVLRTRHDVVPDHFMLSPQGFIHPACYIAVDEVEKIFRHPSRLMMLLAKKVENEFEVASGAAQQIKMTEAELKTQVLELVRNEFGVNSLAQLSADDRLRLCLLMRRNFNSSVKQIARILRLSQSVVVSVL